MIRVRLRVPAPALAAGLLSLLETDSAIVVVDDTARSDTFNQEGDADVVLTTSASLDFEKDPERGASAGPAVLILGNNPMSLRRLLRSGSVAGVLPLDASAEELCAAVRALAAGLVVGSGALLTESDEPATRPGPLTEREAEVLQLLARGLANKQIALGLGISEHTVKFHVGSIYTKLGASSRTEAVREGLRNGWIAL